MNCSAHDFIVTLSGSSDPTKKVLRSALLSPFCVLYLLQNEVNRLPAWYGSS